MADIPGSSGTDYLIGTFEDDLIHAGWSGDFIFANNGDDTISGDAGNDVMIGGAGFDSFNIGPSSGNDLITDLNPSKDVIVIPSGLNVDHYNSLLGTTTLYFDPEGKDTITFLGVTQAVIERSIIYAI